MFLPDCVRETFRERTQLHEGEDAGCSMRCMEWVYDTDPKDEKMIADFDFLLQEEGSQVQAVHDRHEFGLFSRSTWEKIIDAVGFRLEFTRPANGDGEVSEVFLCRRPKQI